jgi:hypothetical protein
MTEIGRAMDKGRLEEFQFEFSQREGLAVPNHADAFGDAIERRQQVAGLLRTEDRRVGSQAMEELQHAGVVRLHVVDDDVIQRADIRQAIDLPQKVISLGGFGEVDQGQLLAFDQIGIVGDPFAGDRPHPLEEIGSPVDHTDPEDARRHFQEFGHGFSLPNEKIRSR